MIDTINIFDMEFSHAGNWRTAGLMCGIRDKEYFDQHVKQTNKVTYVDKQNDWDGITLFTDRFLTRASSVNSKYKIGLISESPIVWGQNDFFANTDAIWELENNFDFIFTFNNQMLKINPKKYKYIPADWIGIEDESFELHRKSELVSMIYSKKGKSLLAGAGDRHLRHQVADRFSDKIHLFGSGSPNGELLMKSKSLNDYMFSISMENCIHDYYYTEKILDCFVTGNIPIFRGCKSIDKFFDTRGIIFWNTLDELDEILNTLSPELYESMLPYAEINYKLSKRYIDPDEVLCRMINNCIANPNFNTMKEFEYERETTN